MIEVTSQNIAAVLSQNRMVVLDFWAPWCGPCRGLVPVLEQVSAELEGKLLVGKMNVEAEPQLANVFNVSSLPTLVYLKDGMVVDQSGVLPKRDILSKIERMAA